ncbi:2-C-methyl-D-erythritol 4-phosphate cytidylyltransferase [Spongisporangium articulatum]|uniref:2-C-methyl-D-erythritol 4-phosphate cytidylyltransferase n=1 Tax=Spongisporangium articulatum TaxID=3362603 RepID=A0ABW8AHC4_9ACTN
MSVWGIVLAGGGGTRFGGLKQFAVVGGRTMLERTVLTMQGVTDGIVLVLPEGHRPPDHLPVVHATGGETRAGSVRNGLAAVPEEAAVVVISDAAHPLASPALYAGVVAAVRAGADAAVPGLPLTDAVKTLNPDGTAGATIPAGGHVSAQMPMAFDAGALRAAHATIPEAVEDSAVVTANGGRVVLVPGDPTNVHVTTQAELAVVQALLPLVDPTEA